MTALILALDVTDKTKAIAIATRCAPHIDAVKVGYPLVLSAGLLVAEELADLDLPLIADFKVADIPNTSRLIAEEVFTSGYDTLICQGFTGRDSVTACVEVAREYGGDCFVVTEMSHPGATEFFHGGIAERIAVLAKECDADGIIAPATRPDRVASLKLLIGDLKIYSPGVGAQGGDISAIASIVDGIIIGRAIYDAEDPGEVALQFAGIRQ
ncbi:MAG: orotidine-5'-phosphate decarboxylase [Methanomicrobiales archaeon]|nr:orotidine-5'-phosphate decarboxylase [Methanomicrobiales archaeon]